MKTYEVTFEVKMTSYNAVVMNIDADSEEEAIDQVKERISSAERDAIYGKDDSLEYVQLLEINEEG